MAHHRTHLHSHFLWGCFPPKLLDIAILCPGLSLLSSPNQFNITIIWHILSKPCWTVFCPWRLHSNISHVGSNPLSVGFNGTWYHYSACTNLKDWDYSLILLVFALVFAWSRPERNVYWMTAVKDRKRSWKAYLGPLKSSVPHLTLKLNPPTWVHKYSKGFVCFGVTHFMLLSLGNTHFLAFFILLTNKFQIMKFCVDGGIKM